VGIVRGIRPRHHGVTGREDERVRPDSPDEVRAKVGQALSKGARNGTCGRVEKRVGHHLTTTHRKEGEMESVSLQDAVETSRIVSA
jgi:hypothetical protein